MTATFPKLHTLEISARPRRSWTQALTGLLFAVVFVSGCACIIIFMLTCLAPLMLIPLKAVRRVYDRGVMYSKGAFANLLLLVCHFFAPTNLVLTFERDGMGKFDPDELENIVRRDERGNVYLNLPAKSVLIANHQVYADWMYAWCLTYFTSTHRNVFIVLKNSLKHIPFVGWGMQMYNFIFLARSWASDRLYLSSRLDWLGHRAEEQDTPFTLIIYPEGTLVSNDTRPISKKFADKIGIPDMTHTLLPRSTGLHYSLRSLVPRIPQLKLIDVTVSYPGIPPLKYGQSYYTLRSMFFDGVPPPAVHMHIRRFDVMGDVPLGNIGASKPGVALPGKCDTQIDITEADKYQFEDWLRDLWREKDVAMTRFLETGSFASDVKTEIVIPLRLRRNWEVVETFCFVVPWVWSILTEA